MNFLILITCIFGVFLFDHAIDAAQVKLPKGFIQCKQKDPDFDRCSQKAAQAAVAPLSKGQPKFGLQPIDPLHISTLFIDQGQGSVNIKLNFTELDVIGLSQSVIEKITVDPHKTNIFIKLKAPSIILNGTYSVIGKILILPISGNGHSKLVLDNFKATSIINFKPIQKSGDAYWQLDNIDFNFNTTRIHMQLENLFNGNKELGDNMNKFLNENWQLLLDELRPAFRKTFSNIYSTFIERFFNHVPINQIFPGQ